MKHTVNMIIGACIALFMTACADDNQLARTPVASFSISSTQLEINQSIELRFNGVADQVVVYTGDKDHVYSLRNENNTGVVMNKGLLTYSYSVPGNFHVVCIASTYDTYMGGGLKKDTTEFDVTVTDDVTTIDKLYSNITPNVYYAELVNNTDWVLRVPSKQLYNNKEIKLNAAKQRLSFTIASDSTSLMVDGAKYATSNYYNLTAVHDIHVVANSGTTRDYKLYTLIYPEFNSFSANGVNAVLTRNAYYQDLQTYTITLPKGTNVSSVVPQFGVDSDVKFYADGVEVTSQTPIDLSNNNVTYTLKRVLDGHPDITATSRIVLSVVFN